MVGIITTAEALPNGRSKYRRCFDQALIPAMFGISGCMSTVIYLWSLTSLISLARAFITFLSYVVSCAGVSPRTPLTRLSEHLFTVGSTIATESWLACHRLRSTGFNPFSVQQLALCCSYQAGPVSRLWCVCSSTGFRFHRGFSSSCAR